jgi:hypothetical protein
MVLGEYITMEQVMALSEKSMIGRFHGRTIAEKYLCSWIDLVWKNRLGYRSNYHILTKGWLVFEFKLGFNVEKILKGNWIQGLKFLALKDRPWIGERDLATYLGSPSKATIKTVE